MSETVNINRSFSRVDGVLHYHGKPMPAGPWQSEPDRVEFEHEGFTCLLVRGGSSWCGYVGVAPGHPWHGKNYDEVQAPNEDGEPDYVNVHGGLTYSAECGGSVCHVPKPGEPEHLWWLGFDCAHSGDLCAYELIEGRRDRFNGHWYDTYKTVEYTRRETVRLADQAKAVSQ